MNIGCDIDDVLCFLTKDFVDYYNKKYNKTAKVDDFYSYAWSEVLGYSSDEFYPVIDGFLSSGAFKTIEPNMPLIEEIKTLSKNHNIYLITARPDKYNSDTIEWLKKYLPNSFKELIYANNSHSYKNDNLTKGEICQKYNIEIMFEDAYKYALTCANKDIKTFLIDKPWNQNKALHKNIIRVSSIDEIKKELEKMNLLL